MAAGRDVATSAIGIDIGAHFCRVALHHDGHTRLLSDDSGNFSTPSFVGFFDTGTVVGEAAAAQVISRPKLVAFDVKQLLGRKMDEDGMSEIISRFPFAVVSGEDNIPMVGVNVQGDHQRHSVEAVMSLLLAKCKETADRFLDREVKLCVVTVPAHFTEAQRDAMKRACGLAGLVVLKLIDEPTAAAIAYNLDTRQEDARNILVFDMSSTFRAALLTCDDAVVETRAAKEEAHLGGAALDRLIADHVLAHVHEEHKEFDEALMDARAKTKLSKACETARRILSVTGQATVEVDALVLGVDVRLDVSEEKLGKLASTLIAATLATLDQVMRTAGVSRVEIDDIIFTGMCTRWHALRNAVRLHFKGKNLHTHVSADQAVAFGAAKLAAALEKTSGGKVHDDKAVLVELTLGIESDGGVMEALVPRGTALPAHRTLRLATKVEQQAGILIRVYEGERLLVKDNKMLGSFVLDGIPSANPGELQVEVEFRVDPDGLLEASARDMHAGISRSLVIAREKRHQNDEGVERLVLEAKQNKSNDLQYRRQIQERIKLEAEGQRLMRVLKQETQAGRIGDGQGKTAVEELVLNTLEWLRRNPTAAYEDLLRRSERLHEVADPIMRQMAYEAGEHGHDLPELVD